MGQPIVTLGGVVSEPNAKLTILMSYYFKSLDYHLGVGDESQYSFTVDLTGDSPADSMQSSVRQLLSGHFDSVSVEVTLLPDSTEYSFKINVTEAGLTYVFKETLDSVAVDFNDYQDIDKE